MDDLVGPILRYYHGIKLHNNIVLTCLACATCRNYTNHYICMCCIHCTYIGCLYIWYITFSAYYPLFNYLCCYDNCSSHNLDILVYICVDILYSSCDNDDVLWSFKRCIIYAESIHQSLFSVVLRNLHRFVAVSVWWLSLSAIFIHVLVVFFLVLITAAWHILVF